ncbi:hypothetical protein [Halomonas saccharevitans]|uniref:Uncharacterized protein n=1 Tax=Halomonas saccharevitans TaxID=416872 RepID=A0A1I7AGU1_9GAMM|nr:hypothetical protein [Halomonas saccharevitans]SFT74093.1 hypothetical protein SAMN04487956_11769 [Halomonas saccharevitans]
MSQPAQWFRDEITTGLARLLVLRLPSAPWEDEAAYTQQTWIDTLWQAPVGWDPELDAGRLRAGFARLAREADRWPVPRQLLEALPSRPQQPRLAKPPMSEAQRRRNQQRMAEMVRELGISSRRKENR